MNVSFFQELLNSVAEQGRSLLPKVLFGSGEEEKPEALAEALVSVRGEASGVAIARQLLERLETAGLDERRAFIKYLAKTMRPDQTEALEAAKRFLADPGDTTMARLRNAVESPRHEFFHRLNLAPGATGKIVHLRGEMLRDMKSDAAYHIVDHDLRQLLQTWFNRGFLVLRRIDWQTPAAILEKIIAYEAVHEIKGWQDLRRRLDPADRRCFAFFHPSLVDEPLIFVEVALMQDIPAAIGPVIDHRKEPKPLDAPSVAAFYSISNCQEGLKGISFGNFLLKQVVEELVREVPSLTTFVTLSPVPHFARWLDRAIPDHDSEIVTATDRKTLEKLRDPRWVNRASGDESETSELKTSILALAAHYFLTARSEDGRPIDPVARFHLGNGARLERINWLGDISEKGLREAHGLMVNYRYELADIERNHEAYAEQGAVAASKAVRSLLRPPAKKKLQVTAPKRAVRLALPANGASEPSEHKEEPASSRTED